MCGKKDSLPRVEVLIGEGFAPIPANILAIADTGAEVTVLGEKYMSILGIKQSMLNPPKTKLKHVAGGDIAVVGSCWLSIQINGMRKCKEETYFVTGVSEVFLSLSVCKSLSLIHKNFPQVIQEESLITEEQEEANLFVGIPGDQAPPINGYHKKLDHIATNKESEPRNNQFGEDIPPKPKEPPFEPREENINKLELWLMESFKELFATDKCPLRVMSGEPQHIHIKHDAVPVAYHTPYMVPVHLRDAVKLAIEKKCKLGIIEKVSVEEVTEWCSRMVVQKKKDGSVRICGDFTELNKNCLRESNPTLPPLNIVSNIPFKTYKTVADAYQGYHQVLLDDESSKLATIITEEGR